MERCCAIENKCMDDVKFIRLLFLVLFLSLWMDMKDEVSMDLHSCLQLTRNI